MWSAGVNKLSGKESTEHGAGRLQLIPLLFEQTMNSSVRSAVKKNIRL